MQQLAESKEVKITMIRQEKIKGPLTKATGTASSATRFNFFFLLTPSDNVDLKPGFIALRREQM